MQKWHIRWWIYTVTLKKWSNKKKKHTHKEHSGQVPVGLKFKIRHCELLLKNASRNSEPLWTAQENLQNKLNGSGSSAELLTAEHKQLRHMLCMLSTAHHLPTTHFTAVKKNFSEEEVWNICSQNRYKKIAFPLQSSAPHGWKTSSHCVFWQNLWQRFHSNKALKIPMMLRLRKRLRRSAPTVPRKEGTTPWATSTAFRDIMSVMTASIWKCVPTTALMWKSWWLWPGRQGQRVIYCWKWAKQEWSFFQFIQPLNTYSHFIKTNMSPAREAIFKSSLVSFRNFNDFVHKWTENSKKPPIFWVSSFQDFSLSIKSTKRRIQQCFGLLIMGNVGFIKCFLLTWLACFCSAPLPPCWETCLD